MKKYKLTPEHRAQFKPWVEKWIENGLSTKPMDDFDREQMRVAIKGLYEAADLTPPPDHRIIFVPSPFVARFAGGFAASIWWKRKNNATDDVTNATDTATVAATYTAKKDATRAAADTATYTATYDATYTATDTATRDATDSATDDATRDATDDAARDAIDDATRDATDSATYADTYAMYATYATTRATIRAATYADTYAATDAATDVTDAAYDATYAMRSATRAATEATAAVTGATYDATYAMRSATRDATDDATAIATAIATADATYDATYAMRSATRAATYDAMDSATIAETIAETRAETRINKNWYGSTEGYIRAGIDLNIGEFGFKCAAQSWRMYQGGNFWSGWTACLSFFRHVAKLPIDYSKFEHWEKATIHGSYRIMHPKFCMISDRPRVLKLDEQGRPHNENGAYIEWADGMGLYAWHGVRVPEFFIMQKHLLTPEMALTWENVEQRRAACEILGWANVLEHPSLNPVIINEDEPHIGTILQVDLPDAPKQWFIKYRCGTGRWFAEAVNDKNYNTALKANAAGNGWRGQGDPMSFIPMIRS
jgi:hypothetical protein